MGKIRIYPFNQNGTSYIYPNNQDLNQKDLWDMDTCWQNKIIES